MATDIAELLQSKQLYRNNITSITNNSIELPEEISSLIVGEAFREARINRYRMLIRQGYLRHLLELAAYCRRVGRNPAFLFAKMASKARWEQTLKTIKNIMEVSRLAADVARRTLARPEQMRAIYKICWRYGRSVIGKAVTAQEVGRDKFRFFCWLTAQNNKMQAYHT